MIRIRQGNAAAGRSSNDGQPEVETEMTVVLTAAALIVFSSTPYVRGLVDDADPNSPCVWWPTPTIRYAQEQAGNPSIDVPGAEFEAARRAFESWQAVSNGCGHLTFVEGRTARRFIGYEVGSYNENVILYRMVNCSDSVPSSDACWEAGTCGDKHDCWQHSKQIIGYTTITFDLHTGALFDADIELNAAAYRFTTFDTPPCESPLSTHCVSTDIQNVLTHEVGHLIGLAHTLVPDSTMAPSSWVGDTTKRVVDSGSAQFVCDVYPKDIPAQACRVAAVEPTCQPEEMSQTPPSTGCQSTGGHGWMAVLAIAVGLARRRSQTSCRRDYASWDEWRR
jgi:hypothetical protein